MPFPFAALAAAGSFASGLGSLASGLGIGGGGANNKARAAALVDQRDELRRDRLDGPSDIVTGARKAGLHPLAVLGQSGYTPTASTTSSKKRFNPAEIGQGVDRALKAGQSAVQRKMDDLTLEKMGLENDYLKTQIAGSVKAISNTGSVPSIHTDNNGRHSSGGLNDYLSRVQSKKLGIEDGLAPKHKIMVGQDGKPVRVLNTDVVGDNEILMAIDAITSTVPDLTKNYIKRHAKNFSRKLNHPRSRYTHHKKQFKKYFAKK